MSASSPMPVHPAAPARDPAAQDLDHVPIYERDMAVADAGGLWLVYATIGLGAIGSVFILVATLLTF